MLHGCSMHVEGHQEQFPPLSHPRNPPSLTLLAPDMPPSTPPSPLPYHPPPPPAFPNINLDESRVFFGGGGLIGRRHPPV